MTNTEFIILQDQEKAILDFIDDIMYINHFNDEEKQELLSYVWELVENQLQQESLCNH